MANSERHDTMELYTKITIKDLTEQVPQVTDYVVSLYLKGTYETDQSNCLDRTVRPSAKWTKLLNGQFAKGFAKMTDKIEEPFSY